MPNRELRLILRAGRTYVDTDDVIGTLRAQARGYLQRAEQLVADEVAPGLDLPRQRGTDGDLVTALDEALACRMVAEVLNQNADRLEAL